MALDEKIKKRKAKKKGAAVAAPKKPAPTKKPAPKKEITKKPASKPGPKPKPKPAPVLKKIKIEHVEKGKRKAHRSGPNKSSYRTLVGENPTTRQNMAKAMEALQRTNGKIHLAATLCGLSSTQIYYYINGSQEFKDEFESIKERVLDIAESKLLSNVNKGNQKAIEYFLNNQGQTRGYGKKEEEAKPVVVRVEFLKDEDEE